MKRWNKFGVLLFLLLMQWLCSAQLAVASTYTYTYTGNDFTSGGVEPPYTVSDRITGSFTLSAPLGDSFSGLVTPISFSFTDGQQTITNSNITHPYGSSFEYIDINTSSSGAILGWSIDLNGPLGYLQTTSADGGSDFAYLNATATYGVV